MWMWHFQTKLETETVRDCIYYQYWTICLYFLKESIHRSMHMFSFLEKENKHALWMRQKGHHFWEVTYFVGFFFIKMHKTQQTEKGLLCMYQFMKNLDHYGKLHLPGKTCLNALSLIFHDFPWTKQKYL